MSTPQQPSPAAVREALASRHWPEANLAVLRAHIAATAAAMREEWPHPKLSPTGNQIMMDTLRRYADRLEGKE
jgi:hypothetical protein